SSVSEATRVCADFLRQSNHTITISPLTRFYALAQDAIVSQDFEKRKSAGVQLDEAFRAIAAFWALWRSSRAGTESIDSYYRNLMLLPPEPIAEHDSVDRFLGLARRCDGTDGNVPNSERLKKALRFILREFGKIDSKATWINKANAQAASK